MSRTIPHGLAVEDRPARRRTTRITARVRPRFLRVTDGAHVALLLAALVVAGACSRDESVTPPSPASAPAAAKKGGGDVIASYGGKEFTTEDFRREVEKLPPRSRMQLTSDERKRQFIENHVMNEILADEGLARGYDRDPEIANQVEQLRRRLIVQRVMKEYQEPPQLTDEEIRKYYDENKSMFSGGQIRAGHILVKDEELAHKLRDEVIQDPTKFEELARKNSIDTATAARGGDLGFFGQGRMVAEFERAAFGLQNPGDVSEVVKTPFGYHIIKLNERKKGEDKPFEQVKDRIRVALLNTRRQEQVNKQFEQLRTKAGFKINEDALTKAEVPSAPVAAPASGAPASGGGHSMGIDALPSPAPIGRDDARESIVPVPPRPKTLESPAAAPAPPGS